MHLCICTQSDTLALPRHKERNISQISLIIIFFVVVLLKRLIFFPFFFSDYKAIKAGSHVVQSDNSKTGNVIEAHEQDILLYVLVPVCTLILTAVIIIVFIVRRKDCMLLRGAGEADGPGNEGQNELQLGPIQPYGPGRRRENQCERRNEAVRPLLDDGQRQEQQDTQDRLHQRPDGQQNDPDRRAYGYDHNYQLNPEGNELPRERRTDVWPQQQLRGPQLQGQATHEAELPRAPVAESGIHNDVQLMPVGTQEAMGTYVGD